jgi:hypothetical protein
VEVTIGKRLASPEAHHNPTHQKQQQALRPTEREGAEALRKTPVGDMPQLRVCGERILAAPEVRRRAAGRRGPGTVQVSG